jgi:ankyrin repeat protein
MLNREHNIRDAMNNTCGWFYSSAEYNSWYTGDNRQIAHGLLWVKGKPGAGKSTIMKNAVQQMRQRDKTSTVASFYFNARGAPLERTPLGLFRSILHQICTQDRGIRLEFLNMYYDRQRAALNPDEWVWSQLELENFLKRIFEKLQPRRTVIFIDALDECDVNTVRSIVHQLAELGATATQRGLDLRICLSSRHYPTISIKNCPEIMVEGANTTDIGTYIRERFKFIPESESETMKTIETRLIENAAGVFLWIVLVVDLLLQDVGEGQPTGLIMERLKRVPKRMEDLYAELCASLKPEEVIFSLRLFQWVLIMDAMSVQDVCLAALFATPGSSEQMAHWGYSGDDTPPTDRLARALKHSSRGLLEYTSGNVQFVHETAREFFVTGPGFGMIDPNLAENPIGRSYEILVMTSLDIIEFPPEWGCVDKLRSYCTKDILNKARKAEAEDVSMVPLLDRIGKSNPRLWNTLDKAPGESVIHFLCRQRLTSCVIACLERGVDPDGHGFTRNGSTPLLVAVRRGFPHKTIPKMVSSLLEHGARVDRCDMQNNSPFMVALRSGNPHLAKILRDAGANADIVNDSGECALHIILDLKAKSRPTNVSLSVQDMSTKEIADQYQRLFDDLVTTGARLDATAFAGSTPLHYAAQIGDYDAVELLLTYGADVNAEDETGSPLCSAAQSTSASAHDVCFILLENGASTAYKDRHGRTPLHIAARCSTTATVKILLDYGFSVHDADANGQTPLHRAAERLNPSTELIGALLDAGGSPHRKDAHGRTPVETALEFFSYIDPEGMLMLQAGQPRRAATWEQWQRQ